MNNNMAKILLVEDEIAHAEIIKRYFESAPDQMQIDAVHTLRDAKAYIGKTIPNLVITDFKLPDGKGIELLNTSKENMHYPVVLMTSQGDEQIAVEAMKLGALDYIVKSDSIFRDMPRIAQRALREWQLVIDKKKADEMLANQYQELERTNKELDRFVYSASHDLSAPLKSILGLVNVIRIETDNNGVLYYLDLMEKSINKLDQFINEIINFSRNSRIELQYEVIHLSGLVKEILENLKFSDRFDEINFNLDINEDIEISADKLRLKMVLNNLISNAIKFQRFDREEQPFVSIVAKDEKDSFIIEVEDNGQGIMEKYADKIFDMFFRATNTSKGSGLGLYIAKEAVNKMGGNITVQSKPNQGSLFRIELSKDTIVVSTQA